MKPDPVRQRRGVPAGLRLASSAVVGAVAGVLVLSFGALRYAPAIGWDVAALGFLVWIWCSVWPMDSGATRTHATRDDPTRAVSDVVLLSAAVISLLAVGFFLIQAASASGTAQDLLAATGVATVVLSWLLVHTVFTLRYAQLFYQSPPGGIDFNQKPEPRYTDFAYLAFTLGMTFQVSDTDLQTTDIRGTALRQALLSYLFGAIILATTINLISGLASKS